LTIEWRLRIQRILQNRWHAPQRKCGRPFTMQSRHRSTRKLNGSSCEGWK
jgi:hypothetical protein